MPLFLAPLFLALTPLIFTVTLAVACAVVSYAVASYAAVSCAIVSYVAVSYAIVSCAAVSCAAVSYAIVSYAAVSCAAVSYAIVSSAHFLHRCFLFLSPLFPVLSFMDHPHPDEHHAPPFGFYPTEQDPSYSLAYPSQLASYQVMQHAANQPRHLLPDLQHQQGLQSFHSLSLIPPHQYQSPVFASSPPHVPLPLSNSPPPPSPDMYDPMSPPVSGSDTSADGFYHHSNSSGANSPSSSRGTSLVHRHIRYNPSPSPTSSSSRRCRGRTQDSDEEDNMGVAFADNTLANTRKEATRRQRIEAEQRRRDELRDGYAKLKEVLPISNQKSSKVSLLERATNHIIALEKTNKELRERLASFEQEMQRLRSINEKISLTAAEATSPAIFDGRALSPPADAVHPMHSLASVKGQQPPLEDSSPSASENGY